MTSYKFPILSAVMLMPMVISPFFYIFLREFDFLPAWLQSEILTANYLIAIFVSIIFFIFFSFHEKNIKPISTYVKNNFISAFFGFGLSAFFLDLNFRDIAQAIGGNIIFSFLNLFFLAVLVPSYKPKIFGLIICLLAGIWFGSSGSKASLFSIILLWIICSNNNSLRYFFYIIAGIIIIAFIDFEIFMRYMDVGLSMLNSMQVCEYSQKSLMNLYFDAFSQYFITGSTFNPTMTFYDEAGLLSAGYNITPTVVGDIVCKPEKFLLYLLFILSYLHLSLSFGYKVFNSSPWINNFHILVLLGIMSSSTFDILKFEILFWMVGLSYSIIKTYSDQLIERS